MSAQPAAQQSVRLHRGWALLHGSGLSLRPPFPERESPHSVAVRRHCQLNAVGRESRQSEAMAGV
jgi:hypothetical protein